MNTLQDINNTYKPSEIYTIVNHAMADIITTENNIQNLNNEFEEISKTFVRFETIATIKSYFDVSSKTACELYDTYIDSHCR